VVEVLSYTVRRIAQLIPVLFGVTFVAFAIVHLIPGNPAQVMLGNEATPAAIAAVDRQFGLNRPLYVQYFDYIGQLLRGNLGKSLLTGQPIAGQIWPHLAATTELAFFSIVFSALIGVNIGVLAAWKKNTWVDYTVMGVALLGVSIPIFWLALMEQWLFGLVLHWLPIIGQSSILSTVHPITHFYLLDALLEGHLGQFWSGVRHLILPGIALGSVATVLIARMTRASMLDILGQDYVRTARAKGLSGLRVLYRHALKNAFTPVLTAIGLSLGGLLEGAVLVETIFGWPGIGLYLFNAIMSRDYPVIQSGILVISLVFILVNLAVDLLYTYLDPRIRLK
jgi:peptide/nickel transport system permease protein